MPAGRWAAVIVNYNGADYLSPCLEALLRTSARPAEIIVVDNASADDSLAELVAYPQATVLAQPRNLGFAGGANVGLAAVETEFALLMNPDVEVDAGFGGELLAAFDADPRLGAAGPLLFFPDGKTVQHAGASLDRKTLWAHHRGYRQPLRPRLEQPADVDYVIGGAMGLRMAAFRAVGGFDERFYPAYYEDTDLCFRLRDAGWAVRYLPALRALHHEGISFQGSDIASHFSQANRIRFGLKHLSPLEWRRDFLPREIDHIRHVLAEASGQHWPETSGMSGLEAVLRNPDLPEAGLPVDPYHAGLVPGVKEALDAARLLSEVADFETGPEGGLAGRLKASVAGNRPPIVLVEALQRQQEFNRAIVAALDAQDKLNREQLAYVLTLALDLAQYVTVNSPPSSAPACPPEESPDES